MLASLDLIGLIAVFAGAAAVIALAGWRLSRLADLLADRTGLGEAVVGALLLGATTSLSGSVTSITAAASGRPDLAISNAIGGIVVQTAFLAIADLTYTKANLEHAAASTGNLLSCGLLVTMLSIPLATAQLPAFSWWGVHPVSLVLPTVYLLGLVLLKRVKAAPMWVPKQTAQTREDVAQPQSHQGGLAGIVVRFAALAGLVGVAGWVIAEAGVAITQRTALSESAVGGIFTAVSTSLPELVTSIAAVRRGALTLAVGGIIGGNAFDVIFLAAADVAYRPGSLYHQMTATHMFLFGMALLMTGVLTMGLVYRQERGWGRIGFESVAVLLLYAVALVRLFVGA